MCVSNIGLLTEPWLLLIPFIYKHLVPPGPGAIPEQLTIAPLQIFADSADQKVSPTLLTSRKPSNVVFVEGGTNSRMHEETGASDFVGSLT